MTALSTRKDTTLPAPPLSQQDLARLGERSTVLSQAYMAHYQNGGRPGEMIPVAMSRQQLTDSSRLFQQAMSPAPLPSVAEVIKRMLAHYSQKDVPDTVAEDWLRHLQNEPFAAIWQAYERQITSNEAFAPRLGEFLTVVRGIAKSFAFDLSIIERCEPTL